VGLLAPAQRSREKQKKPTGHLQRKPKPSR
jgi:hypothetical protein